MHARLGIDPRQADQTVRSTVVLPHGTGKTVRVLVFAAGEAERVAREAGADYVGVDDLVQQIQGGWLEFDAAIAMADQMGKVGGLGRILGRRGLMPNPRSGTVVRDVSDLPGVLSELKGGRVEFRNDRTGIVHLGSGAGAFRRPDQGQPFRLRRCPAASQADWRQRRLPAYTDCQEHDVPIHLDVPVTVRRRPRPENRLGKTNDQSRPKTVGAAFRRLMSDRGPESSRRGEYAFLRPGRSTRAFRWRQRQRGRR